MTVTYAVVVGVASVVVDGLRLQHSQAPVAMHRQYFVQALYTTENPSGPNGDLLEYRSKSLQAEAYVGRVAVEVVP